jgi:hypothetical protein
MTSGMTSLSRHRPKDARWSALSAWAAVSMGGTRVDFLPRSRCSDRACPAPRTHPVWVLPHTGHVVVDQVVTVKPRCGLS